MSSPYADLSDTEYTVLADADYAKSSYSNANAGCVSLARVGDRVGLQDTKLPAADRAARTLVFTPAELAAFVAGAKAGEFDHLTR